MKLAKTDIFLMFSITVAVAAFVAPLFLNPGPSQPELMKTRQDVKVIGEAILAMEKDTGDVSGLPGPNPCVNDPEYTDLASCELGLICNHPIYKNWKGPYLTKISKDIWGHNYYIDNDYYIGKEIQRVVGSKGPNGVQDYGPASDDIIYTLCVHRES